MVESPPLLRQVERLHALLAAVAVVAAFVLAPRPVWAGVLAGVLVGAGNFRALTVLVMRMIQGETTHRNTAVMLLAFKFMVLAAVLGAIVHWLQPDGVAFLAGLTLAPVCLVALVLRGRRPADTPAPAEAPR